MITYYTDGSASPNPGPGGYAVIKDGQPYILGGEPSGAETTNIRMEGLAIKAAINDSNGAECQIYTDSEFWINVITKWAPGWEANGWKKKGGEIKNLDIVQDVYPLYTSSKATLTWVRGHEGDEGNEMADEWANKAREQKATDPQKLEQKELSVVEHAHACLDVGQVMQLGTLHEGHPRVNSVYFVVNDVATKVYWMSEPHRRHSEDIVVDNRVSGAVAVKTNYPVIGIQFMGTAQVVNADDEVKMAAEKYAAKYNGFGGDFYDRFKEGTNKHQLYSLTIESLELFDEVHFPDKSPLLAS
jgi:ribonuclease HI